MIISMGLVSSLIALAQAAPSVECKKVVQIINNKKDITEFKLTEVSPNAFEGTFKTTGPVGTGISLKTDAANPLTCSFSKNLSPIFACSGGTRNSPEGIILSKMAMNYIRPYDGKEVTYEYLELTLFVSNKDVNTAFAMTDCTYTP